MRNIDKLNEDELNAIYPISNRKNRKKFNGSRKEFDEIYSLYLSQKISRKQLLHILNFTNDDLYMWFEKERVKKCVDKELTPFYVVDRVFYTVKEHKELSEIIRARSKSKNRILSSLEALNKFLADTNSKYTIAKLKKFNKGGVRYSSAWKLLLKNEKL